MMKKKNKTVEKNDKAVSSYIEGKILIWELARLLKVDTESLYALENFWQEFYKKELKSKKRKEQKKLIFDPLILNIPNICFSRKDKDDEIKLGDEFAKQRIERGFDDTEIWELCDTVYAFLLPRLIRFKELGDYSLPNGVSAEEWEEYLGKMIIFLQNELFELPYDPNRDYDETDEIAKEGKKLLFEYFENLWS